MNSFLGRAIFVLALPVLFVLMIILLPLIVLLVMAAALSGAKVVSIGNMRRAAGRGATEKSATVERPAKDDSCVDVESRVVSTRPVDGEERARLEK